MLTSIAMDKEKNLYKVLYDDELSKGDRKRIEILELILNCIGKHGIDKVTYQLIAKEGKLRTSHIAYYFPNKDELIKAVFKHLVSKYQNRVVSSIYKSEDTKKVLSAIVEAYLGDKNRDKEISMAYLFYHYSYINADIRDLCTETYNVGFDRVCSILSPYLREKNFSKRQIEVRARSIIGLIGESVRFVATTNTKSNLAQLKRDTKREVIALLDLPS